MPTMKSSALPAGQAGGDRVSTSDPVDLNSVFIFRVLRVGLHHTPYKLIKFKNLYYYNYYYGVKVTLVTDGLFLHGWLRYDCGFESSIRKMSTYSPRLVEEMTGLDYINWRHAIKSDVIEKRKVEVPVKDPPKLCLSDFVPGRKPSLFGIRVMYLQTDVAAPTKINVNGRQYTHTYNDWPLIKTVDFPRANKVRQCILPISDWLSLQPIDHHRCAVLAFYPGNGRSYARAYSAPLTELGRGRLESAGLVDPREVLYQDRPPQRMFFINTAA